jgi:hypothetical protein
MRESRIKTLVLHAQYTTRLSYYDDWLDAFQAAPRFDVQALNICPRDAGEALRPALAEAELVVLLHSTNGDTTIYLEPLAPLLAARRAILVSFVGNEFNAVGSPIAAKRRVFAAIRPDIIATQLLQEAGEYLFGDLAGQVIAVPHALNPEAFRPERPAGERAIDIGVRAARYLPHLGDDDRNRVHDLFAANRFAPPLSVDVGSERLTRADWSRFLNACRGTVSCEAGSWYHERDDATVEAIRQWARQRLGGRLVIANDSALRRLGHKLPWGLRALLRRALSAGPLRHEATVNEALPHAEVHARFFANRPRPPVYGKCISSRHFDAIGTKTCQIMLPGRYNDLLVADRDYIALAADFANLDDALARFRDEGYRQAMVDGAYERVLARHTYRHRIDRVADAVSAG